MEIKNNLDYSIISLIIINDNFGEEIEIRPGEEKEIPLPKKHFIFDILQNGPYFIVRVFYIQQIIH